MTDYDVVVVVNREGRRFMSEDAPCAVAGDIENAQTDKVCFAIFDQHSFETADGKGCKDGDMPGALCENIRRYNACVERGRDDEYFKNLSGTTPVVKAPFYATPVRTLVNTVSGAGLRIDAEAQVHSEADEVIPGLYAAGEAAGGLVGYCIGGGGSLGPPVIFGRAAGGNAARYAPAAARK